MSDSSLIKSVLGPIVVGTFVNTFLYGISVFQYGSYLSIRFRDKIWVKLVVGALFVVDFFHTLLAIYQIWAYCVKGFGNIESWDGYEPAYFATPLFVGLTGTFAHGVLTYNIYQSKKSKYELATLLIGPVLTFVLGIVSMAIAIRVDISIIDSVNKTQPVFDRIFPPFTGWLTSQFVTNLLFTVILSLSVYRSKVAFRSSDPRTTRVLRRSLQTGTFAVLLSIFGLIGFLTSKGVNTYALFIIPLGRVYSLAAMDVLLCRDVNVNSSNASDGFGLDTPRAYGSLA